MTFETRHCRLCESVAPSQTISFASTVYEPATETLKGNRHEHEPADPGCARPAMISLPVTRTHMDNTCGSQRTPWTSWMTTTKLRPGSPTTRPDNNKPCFSLSHVMPRIPHVNVNRDEFVQGGRLRYVSLKSSNLCCAARLSSSVTASFPLEASGATTSWSPLMSPWWGLACDAKLSAVMEFAPRGVTSAGSDSSVGAKVTAVVATPTSPPGTTPEAVSTNSTAKPDDLPSDIAAAALEARAGNPSLSASTSP
mmetsp:Transcript_33190/g.91476  ORF Transcript_33190/g.91476 Transcript_33190/m.91476 type:complete len:253 (+) Transcript_33190:1444-2202(+)